MHSFGHVDHAGEAVPLLEVRNLEKVYGHGTAATRALDDVSFKMQSGEFASIIGQSGSGKSTLMNMVGLLDRPSGGEVFLRGESVGALSSDRRAELRNELLGFVFQFHYLLPEFSVFENVAMPARIRGVAESVYRPQVAETLELLGLSGFDRKNANDLSGGQKQRVAIARALVNRPALVLADEPTGNLDTKNTDLVYDLFREINQSIGTAFLFVTHDKRMAERADRILEVEDGKLVLDDAVPHWAK